jgi:hypothetical protein
MARLLFCFVQAQGLKPATFPGSRGSRSFFLVAQRILPLVLLFKNPSFYWNNAKGRVAGAIALLLYNKDLVKSRKSSGALFSSSEDADEGRLVITAVHYLRTGS